MDEIVETFAVEIISDQPEVPLRGCALDGGVSHYARCVALNLLECS